MQAGVEFAIIYSEGQNSLLLLLRESRAGEPGSRLFNTQFAQCRAEIGGVGRFERDALFGFEMGKLQGASVQRQAIDQR